MKLSIIVPVYNVEKYLPKCIDSLLNQDIDKNDYEIILVNDGSTDNSGIIAKEYESSHFNIVLIDQENKGLSAARNTGITAAVGEYIQFVDSDDFIEKNVLSNLLSIVINDDLDVLQFNYQNVNDSYEVYHPYKHIRNEIKVRLDIYDGLFFLNNIFNYSCYVVQFLIKKNLIITNNIYFKNNIYFEDVEWTPRILIKATKVKSVDILVYNYLLRAGSITQSVDYNKKIKILNDKLLLIDCLKSQMSEVTEISWYEGMIRNIVLSIVNIISLNFYNERGYYLNKLIHMNVIPLTYKNIFSQQILKTFLINLSVNLACWLIFIKNNRK